MGRDELLGRWARLLESSGLPTAACLFASYDAGSFGNAVAVYACGPLTLRFTRDRGQEFLDIRDPEAPSRYYTFEDVAVALGWRTVDEGLQRDSPRDIEAELEFLAPKLAAIALEMRGENWFRLREVILDVEKTRSRRIWERL